MFNGVILFYNLYYNILLCYILKMFHITMLYYNIYHIDMLYYNMCHITILYCNSCHISMLFSIIFRFIKLHYNVCHISFINCFYSSEYDICQRRSTGLLDVLQLELEYKFDPCYITRSSDPVELGEWLLLYNVQHQSQ